MQVILIILTMFFGAIFLGVKAIEYTDKYNHGLIPVDGLEQTDQEARSTEPRHRRCRSKRRAGRSSQRPSEEHHVNPRGEFQMD